MTRHNDTADRGQTTLTLLVFASAYPVLYALDLLVSRELGAAEYGDFAVSRAVATLVATLAILGFDATVLRFIPGFLKAGENALARGFAQTALGTVLFLGLLVSVVGFGVTEWLQSRFGLDEHPALIAMVWVLPLAICSVLIALLTAHQRVLTASFMDRVLLPVVTMGSLAATRHFMDRFDAYDAVVVFALARVALVLGAVILLRADWLKHYAGVRPVRRRREWYAAALPALATALVVAAMAHVGTLILEAHHPSEEEVGLFAAVSQVARFTLLAVAAVTVLALPELSILVRSGDRIILLRRLGHWIRVLALIGVTALTLFAVFGNVMIGWFGAEFTNGRLPLVVLGIGYLVAIVAALAAPMLQLERHNQAVTVGMLAMLAINVGLNYLLAPAYGALGAAMAYTLAVSVCYLLQIYWLQRRAGIPYLGLLFGART